MRLQADWVASVLASLGAIVDVYDAITGRRVYCGGISAEGALKRMYEWRRKDFQPELVEEFIRCMGIFPIGSLVELNTGGIGVVVTINRERRLKPKVALVLRASKEPYTERFIADLAKHHTRTGGELRIKRVLPTGAFGIDPVDHIAGDTLNQNPPLAPAATPGGGGGGTAGSGGSGGTAGSTGAGGGNGPGGAGIAGVGTVPVLIDPSASGESVVAAPPSAARLDPEARRVVDLALRFLGSTNSVTP